MYLLSLPPFRFTVYLTCNCNQDPNGFLPEEWWPHVLYSKEAMNDIMKIANDSNTAISAHINFITFLRGFLFERMWDYLTKSLTDFACILVKNYLSRNHSFKNEDHPSFWTFILGLDSGVFVSTLWLQCHSELRGQSRVGTISRWYCVRSHRNFRFRRGRRKQDFKEERFQRTERNHREGEWKLLLVFLSQVSWLIYLNVKKSIFVNIFQISFSFQDWLQGWSWRNTRIRLQKAVFWPKILQEFWMYNSISFWPRATASADLSSEKYDCSCFSELKPKIAVECLCETHFLMMLELIQ